MINTLFTNPVAFVLSLIALLIAITIHEFAHAWMADRLGDPTPKLQGRLTLNPVSHIDLYGLLFLLMVGFGWGKPVQFDPFNLKNPRKDAALISIAGPISNFLLAIVCSLLVRLAIVSGNPSLMAIFGIILPPIILLNVILGVFNLLPISPLDGFKIVGGLLPRDQAKDWYGLERYGIIFLILLIIPLGRTSMLDAIIRPAVSFILNLLIPLPGIGMV